MPSTTMGGLGAALAAMHKAANAGRICAYPPDPVEIIPPHPRPETVKPR